MTTSLAERIWPACWSALALDRWLAGEMEAAEAERLRGHLAGCARCAAALAELRSGAQEPLPPLRVVPLPARPRSRLRAAAAVVGLAAAASLLLIVRAPGTRSKGSGFALGMYVAHGNEVRAGGPGDVVAPGDAVRFTVTAPSEVHVGVLSLDAKGHASIYFPAGRRAELVHAGREVPLPLGTRLDETMGEEQIVGLFCPSPVDLEPVRLQLERGDFAAPDGCQVTRWSFVKR